jgi:hypothetical protein
MSSAWPVEVFLFKVFFAAKFANFLIDVECATVFETSYSNPHFVSLVLQTLDLFILLDELLPCLNALIFHSFYVLIQLCNSLTVLCEQSVLFQVISLDYRRDFLQVSSQLVTISENLKLIIYSLLRLNLQLNNRFLFCYWLWAPI